MSLAEYRTQGFSLLRGMLSAEEVARYRDEAMRLLDALGRPLSENGRVNLEPPVAGAPPVVRKVEPFIDFHRPFAELAESPRLLGSLERFFGEPYTLFCDKITYKPPKVGSAFPWHCDAPYWAKYPASEIMTVMIYLDAADADRGGLQVLPGSHLKEYPRVDPARGDGRQSVIPAEEEARAADVRASAGDALLFHSGLQHRSLDNHSDAYRRTLLFSYNPARLGSFFASRLLDRAYHKYMPPLRAAAAGAR